MNAANSAKSHEDPEEPHCPPDLADVSSLGCENDSELIDIATSIHRDTSDEDVGAEDGRSDDDHVIEEHDVDDRSKESDTANGHGF